MKLFKILLLSILLAATGFPAQTQFSLPPEIATGFARSSISESGKLSVVGVDEKVFKDYVREHWREILDHIDALPLAESSPGVIYTNDGARNYPKENFGRACEVLPPVDYVEFLDKWLDLLEAKRIPYGIFDQTFWGRDEKQDFVSVNWQHPRMNAILRRALRLTPHDKEYQNTIDLLEEELKGELADNYMTNESDDHPFPQTLPGIKLKLPFGMRPSHPRWQAYETQWRLNHERIKRGEIPRPAEYFEEASSSFWQWLIGGLVVLIGAFVLWRMKRQVR